MLKDTRDECVLHKDPLERPDYIESDVQAIRALYSRTASGKQQRDALDWMIWAFGTHDTSYRPDSARNTDFAEGRRHAGTTLVWMIKSAATRTDPDKIAARSAGDKNE